MARARAKVRTSTLLLVIAIAKPLFLQLVKAIVSAISSSDCDLRQERCVCDSGDNGNSESTIFAEVQRNRCEVRKKKCV